MQLLLKRAVVVAAMSVGLLALSLGSTAPAAEAASCTSGWTVAKTLPTGSSLHKVSALSGNAWAIGERARGDGSGIKDALTMRFDGTRWTEVPVPEVAELAVLHPDLSDFRSVRLGGVYARTATDAWAVGHVRADIENEPLHIAVTMRWNGTAWRYVRTDHARGESHYYTLRDVVAFGPDDAWAVGSYTNDATDMLPLAMHWDGQRWTPDARVWDRPRTYGVSGELLAAARTPYAQTLWAVGHEGDSGELTGTNWHAGLIARYRSDSWTQMPDEPDAILQDVAAVAWNDAWAVGRQGRFTVALHRDATRWSAVPTPGTGELTVVSAVASDDVWAIGRTFDSPSKPLMQHWDGTSWVAVTPPAGIERLADAALRPKSGWGWAVGATATRGVILRHCP